MQDRIQNWNKTVGYSLGFWAPFLTKSWHKSHPSLVICLQLYIMCWSHSTDILLIFIHLFIHLLQDKCPIQIILSTPIVNHWSILTFCQHRYWFENTLYISARSFDVCQNDIEMGLNLCWCSVKSKAEPKLTFQPIYDNILSNIWSPTEIIYIQHFSIET